MMSPDHLQARYFSAIDRRRRLHSAYCAAIKERDWDRAQLLHRDYQRAREFERRCQVESRRAGTSRLANPRTPHRDGRYAGAESARVAGSSDRQSSQNR